MIRRLAVLLALVARLAPAAAEEPQHPPDAAKQQNTAPAAATGTEAKPPPDAAAQQKPLSTEEEAALSRALAADAAADSAKTPAAPSLPGPIARAIQSLNPDISAILDFAAGWYSNDHAVKSGDDPGQTGLNLQEMEVGLQATVDPYFRGDVFLTIPNAQGLEVEEAYVTSTSLPWNLQVRAGMFRAAFGRQNMQHLHLQDFTRRPTLNALLLGPDGLRAPGAEVSLLLPLPFYLLLTGEALSVSANDDPGAAGVSTFGGGARKDVTWLGNLRTFIPLGENTSALLGLSFATGLTSLRPGGVWTPLDGHRSRLYGADLYVKWKPPNVSNTYMSLAWTTEYILREVPDFRPQNLEGALYSQLVWQVARRWFLGARGEIDGLPAGMYVPREYAASGSLTFALSEFARARLYAEARFPSGGDASFVSFLQIEVALGAHGAHPY